MRLFGAAAARVFSQLRKKRPPFQPKNYLRRQKHNNRSKVQVVLSHTGQIKNELARALLAEFMGTLLFQIFGGAAPPKDTTAPAANGFALVAIIYAFANVSGAHLNPAVTFSLMCTGHTTWWRGLAYIAVQV